MIINVDWNKNGARTSHYTTIKPGPNPKYALPPKLGKEFIQITNMWLFDGPFPLEWVHSGLLMDFILKF
jgi:hypothetical protein